MTDSTINLPIMSLPEEIESHVYGFLTTQDLTKYNAVNSETREKTKACVFLRRIHSMVREKSWFDNCEIQWNIERERIVLTSIRDKLLNEVQCDPDFCDQMDTNSLVDFNRSIEWLDNYDENYEFVDLLLAISDLWSSYELVYIDNWNYEFKCWFAADYAAAATWRWECPLIHKMFDPEIRLNISANA